MKKLIRDVYEGIKLALVLFCVPLLFLSFLFVDFDVHHKPRFWWIRRRTYKKWKEKREKERQELLLEAEKEKRERQKRIEAGEIIEMTLWPDVPATAYNMDEKGMKFAVLAVDTLTGYSKVILDRLRMILTPEYVATTEVGEGVLFIKTKFTTATEFVNFLKKNGVDYAKVPEQHWTIDRYSRYRL